MSMKKKDENMLIYYFCIFQSQLGWFGIELMMYMEMKVGAIAKRIYCRY